MIERRSLITGLVALVAAPAIVKASSLMQVAPTERLRGAAGLEYWEYNPLFDKWTQYSRSAGYLTIDEITRESVRLFKHNNEFIKSLTQRIDPALIPRIDPAWTCRIEPQIPTPLAVAALAVAAAPVVEQVLQKPVTRRFWSK